MSFVRILIRLVWLSILTAQKVGSRMVISERELRAESFKCSLPTYDHTLLSFRLHTHLAHRYWLVAAPRPEQ